MEPAGLILHSTVIPSLSSLIYFKKGLTSTFFTLLLDPIFAEYDPRFTNNDLLVSRHSILSANFSLSAARRL